MECSENGCDTCGEFKARPIEFKLYRVRGLNKPFTRHGRVFGNILHLIDSAIEIITFGHFWSNIGSEWIRRDLDKFSQYNQDNEGGFHFKLRPFKFKITRVKNISKPFTRSERVFGQVLRMIDSLIGVMTFGHFDSFLSHDWSSRSLSKLGQFIKSYGIDAIKKS